MYKTYPALSSCLRLGLCAAAIALTLSACQHEGHSQSSPVSAQAARSAAPDEAAQPAKPAPTNAPAAAAHPRVLPAEDAYKKISLWDRLPLKAYPWLEESAAEFEEPGRQFSTSITPLSTLISPPAGFQRVDVEPDSFAYFLRGLPIYLPDRDAKVRAWNGDELSSPAAQIVALDVGKRDLQQCADSIIRLHAEYLWSKQKFAALGYHFTSGDLSRWEDWKGGERFKVAGNRVSRYQTKPSVGTHAQFRQWLDLVFMYAGTRSLARDSEPVAAQDVRPGDFFVDPGSPGHALIVLDMAVDADGKRVALLGQGFMPAQQFHVLKADRRADRNQVWFRLPDAGEGLHTPPWRPFSSDDIRRFKAR